MRAATTRRPAFSKRLRTWPMRLRATPSGLTMEKVRSSAMNRFLCGGLEGARLYRAGPRIASKSLKNKCCQALTRPFGPVRKSWGVEATPSMQSHVEGLPAATLALDVGVMEAEGLVEALFDEVDRGAPDERQALWVHEHLHAPVFEHQVAGGRVVGVVHHVGKPRAAGLAHAEPQAQALAARGEEGLDPFG